MSELMHALYDAEQVRELDRRAIASGIDGYTLMQRAALACWQAMSAQPQPRSVSVLCGTGNNGGDGYEIARLARAAGAQVRVVALAEPRAGSEAARARRAWLGDGGTIEEDLGALARSDWVVDALLGTGLGLEPQGAMQAAIAAINRARDEGARVLAVDVPSGLDASSGHVPGDCVHADVTVTFIGNKLGLWTGRGPAFSGKRVYASLDVPSSIFAGLLPRARLQSARELSALAPRRRDAHKNLSGHVLVIGGNHGMAGAALLAGRAALRAGAGLVTLATRREHAPALTAAQPELMVAGIDDADALDPLLARASVVALGPGLGQDEWARTLYARVLAGTHPLIVDADALNLLARFPRARGNWVLTPHPGEAGRLLQCSTAQVQAQRLEAAERLAARYHAVVVLKGAGSIISGTPAHICAEGNPGMAVAGMGDALTGVIAALWAQTGDAQRAAQLGVLAHACAGDRAARGGERGLLPSDVIAELRSMLNPS
ncbi:NAD(P)H-hydrate dehydratase [Sinimarinibacterium thermocellulolyticum]|uniref:Bifunctional NAD(P)H-hydrate repair enzyme n=1 Tax=Sinimarinibacterium thermocellulolyticum TaxID=3170016 RepID=A0ABV2AA75_9GAMM